MQIYLPKVAQTVKQAGFTMIELLIVITILGFLSVAVLSVINPIEQINRGKDTGSQQDAEQLLSAIDRYYASNGTYPWQGTGAGAANYPDEYPYNSGSAPDSLSQISSSYVYTDASGTYSTSTLVLDELKNADEIKNAFVERLKSSTNPLYIYYDGTPGDSVYACFQPKSKDFRKKAARRCGNATDAANNMPSDLSAVVSTICATDSGWTDANNPPEDIYYCLP